METGTVKWFSLSKGRGFIKPDDGKHNVFVGIQVVRNAGLSDLKQGQRITFEIDRETRMGWACARSVALLNPTSQPAHAALAVPESDGTQRRVRLDATRFYSLPISILIWSAFSVLLPRSNP